MANRYVRKTGSDANAGTSAGAAWLTIGKALTAMASGDVCYVGAGVYREAVTVTITPTAETKLIADTDGAQTGDAGEVRWTAYATNDKTLPVAANTLNLNSKNYLTIQGFVVVGGTGTIVTTGNSTNCKFVDCTFLPGSAAGIGIFFTVGANTSAAWTIDGCRFVAQSQISIYIQLATSATADYDANVLIQNCLFAGGATASIYLQGTGASAFKGGGVDCYNCTKVGYAQLMQAGDANIATSIASTVYNSYICVPGATGLQAATTGQIVEDYNVIFAATPRTNVNAGANSISDGSYSNLFHLGQELVVGRALRPFGAPTVDSPLLGFGAQAGGPSDDLLDITRPSGPGATWANALKAVGCYERGDSWTKETATVRTGSNGASIKGPGVHDFQIPVDAVATTVSVWMRYDGTYAGTKPQLQVLANGEIGVSAATATQTGAANAWEQLSLTFTPTAAGIVRIRLISSSTAGSGYAFADDFSIT